MRYSIICVALLSMAACVNDALSQTYPSKLIRLIVPSSPGGGTDITGRLISQKLRESLGHSVIVENRPGVSGIVGTGAMAKAAPDGYTIGMAQPGPLTIARSLFATLPYDPDRDFAPVILANESANVLAVHPSVPAHSVKELIALARAHSFNAAYNNIASVQYLLTDMFNRAAGIKMNTVPYKGGALAVTDVVGGQVELMWSVLPLVQPFFQSGRLRAICVASRKRSPLLPAVPTTAESGWPAVVGTAWNGVVAPSGTPRNIVDRLNEEIARGLDAPDTREHYSRLGMEPFAPNTPEEFGAFLRAETVKWREVIRTAKIKLE